MGHASTVRAGSAPSALRGEFSFFSHAHNPPQTGPNLDFRRRKSGGFPRSARKSRLVSLRRVVRALPSVAVRRPLSIRAPAPSSPTPRRRLVPSSHRAPPPGHRIPPPPTATRPAPTTTAAHVPRV